MKNILSLYIIGFLFIQIPFHIAAASEAVKFSSVEWPKTDFNKHNISFDEILSGGPPKNGIPAIDKPRFVKSDNAKKWLKPLEPVIAIKLGSEAKAYPLQILMFHEIVNDVLNGQAIAVTFCPLCNSSMVFSRKVNGRTLDFGTTGRLRNSDLIMYDRQTESWWQQFTGEGLIGFYTDTELTELTSNIISFQAFQQHYPNGKILSRETGFSRQYGKNPYRGYDDINNTPFLMRGPIDTRLPPMERVLSVKISDQQKLYPFSTIDDSTIIHDKFNGQPLVIFKTGDIYSALDQYNIDDSKKVSAYSVFSTTLNSKQLHFYFEDKTIKDRETKSEWSVVGKAVKGKLKGKQLPALSHGIHFAFAWLAFNPNVEIFKP